MDEITDSRKEGTTVYIYIYLYLYADIGIGGRGYGQKRKRVSGIKHHVILLGERISLKLANENIPAAAIFFIYIFFLSFATRCAKNMGHSVHKFNMYSKHAQIRTQIIFL